MGLVGGKTVIVWYQKPPPAGLVSDSFVSSVLWGVGKRLFDGLGPRNSLPLDSSWKRCRRGGSDYVVTWVVPTAYVTYFRARLTPTQEKGAKVDPMIIHVALVCLTPLHSEFG